MVSLLLFSSVYPNCSGLWLVRSVEAQRKRHSWQYPFPIRFVGYFYLDTNDRSVKQAIKIGAMNTPCMQDFKSFVDTLQLDPSPPDARIHPQVTDTVFYIGYLGLRDLERSWLMGKVDVPSSNSKAALTVRSEVLSE